jgi:hypothetical protein
MPASEYYQVCGSYVFPNYYFQLNKLILIETDFSIFLNKYGKI